jgi:hypothetical protein
MDKLRDFSLILGIVFYGFCVYLGHEKEEKERTQLMLDVKKVLSILEG